MGGNESEKIDRIGKKKYNKELFRLQLELIKLQEWVKAKGLKVVIVFEGRDAAGKGGVIKEDRAVLNPRVVGGCSASPHRETEDRVVLPEVCQPSPRCRRDSDVRQKLVQ